MQIQDEPQYLQHAELTSKQGFEKIIATIKEAKRKKMEKVLRCEIRDEEVSLTSDDFREAKRLHE